MQKVNNLPSKYTIEDLNFELAKHIDNTRIWTDGRVLFVKAFVDSVDDLKIVLYPMDHLPAHFHVISKQRKINARFDLLTLEYISTKEGFISNDDIKKIKNFFMIRKDRYEFLQSEYKRLQGVNL